MLRLEVHERTGESDVHPSYHYVNGLLTSAEARRFAGQLLRLADAEDFDYE